MSLRSLNRGEVAACVREPLSGGNFTYVFTLHDGSRWSGFGKSARQAMLSVCEVKEVVS